MTPPPPRRLIVCIDGTDGAPTRGRTNVARFYRMLDKDRPDQLAYYQPGVGTLDPESPDGWLRDVWRRGWDLATASLLRRHVLSAYAFLMNHYREGDEIHLYGFSRGAYTCRVLAGMLMRVGLIHPGQQEMLDFAWKVYRSATKHPQARRFRKYFGRRVNVRLLGIWDTVRSVGVPWRPAVFPNTFRNPAVLAVRHAISLDERRALYAPNQWTSKGTHGQDVRQVWFPGAHADVGGGHASDESDPGLATIPLAWMVSHAEAAGVRFVEAERQRLLSRRRGKRPADVSMPGIAAEFASDLIHDELDHWRWRILEYIPFPRKEQKDDKWVRRWRPHLGAPRHPGPDALFHESIRLRMAADPRYRPPNLPADATFVLE